MNTTDILVDSWPAELPGFDSVGFYEKMHRFFCPSYAREQAQLFADLICARLSLHHDDRVMIPLADRFITTYSESRALGKIAKVFDRTVGRYRVVDEVEARYLDKANRKGFEKWCSYGMPTQVYIDHQDFCNWMERTRLLSQMKVTRNRARDTVHMLDEEPAIFVTFHENQKPQLVKWYQLQKIFHIKEVKEHGEVFLCHNKQTTVYKEDEDPKPTVYTYLDNKRGLQPYHPYYTAIRPGEKLTPLSRLSKAEYSTIRERGRAFVREGEEGLTAKERAERNSRRTFILQIVSSYVKAPNTNLHEVLVRRKHPYLRIIIGKNNPKLKTQKREVLEVGYNRKGKPGLPFVANEGWFRSPDRWNFMPREESVVTNIALTQEEAHLVFDFTMGYHRNQTKAIGFHLAYQNCSVYIREACLAAGIRVPTLIRKMEVFKRILPDRIQAIGRAFKTAYTFVKNQFYKLYHLLPTCITDPLTSAANAISVFCQKTLAAFSSFSLFPIRAAIGGFLGRGGREFDAINAVATEPAEEGRIEAPLWHPRRWFTFFSELINLPGVLQEWQRKQPSTDVHDKRRDPTLAIVK